MNWILNFEALALTTSVLCNIAFTIVSFGFLTQAWTLDYKLLLLWTPITLISVNVVWLASYIFREFQERHNKKVPFIPDVERDLWEFRAIYLSYILTQVFLMLPVTLFSSQIVLSMNVISEPYFTGSIETLWRVIALLFISVTLFQLTKSVYNYSYLLKHRKDVNK